VLESRIQNTAFLITLSVHPAGNGYLISSELEKVKGSEEEEWHPTPVTPSLVPHPSYTVAWYKLAL